MRTFQVVAGAIACLALGASVQATVLYENDFSTSGLTTTGGTWTITPDERYKLVATGAISPFATTQLSGVDAYPAITLSTKFSINASSLNSNNQANSVGFATFGDAATPANYYQADYSVHNNDFLGTDTPEGTLRLAGVGTGASSLIAASVVSDQNPSHDRLAVVLDQVYTLRLDAVFNPDTSITFTLGLYDELGTTQLGSSVTATTSTTGVLSGEHFGVRARVPASGNNFTAHYDDFTIEAVPEPTALSLLGLGSLLSLRRRR